MKFCSIFQNRSFDDMMNTINVLIACEESQAETKAFLELGFNAFSCDVKSCKKGADKSRHIQADVTPLLAGQTTFVTMDEIEHHIPGWDLIIAHPPCTYLCKVGSVWMVTKGVLNEQRYAEMLDAREFFFKCLNAKAHFVAVENPLPMALAQLPRPSCYIQPSWYGVKYTKKTLYWLKNLPPLMPEIIYPNPKSFVRCSRSFYRARTFPQVAQAMAKQWGEYIKSQLSHHAEDDVLQNRR